MKRRASLVVAALLGGCSTTPAYVRPQPPVPTSWPAGDAYLRQSEATLPSLTFEQVFRDARLRRLVNAAIANNRDLRIAAANIASARAQYRIQRVERFPAVGVAGQAAIGDGAGLDTSFSADVGITAFEIDLFGRVRALGEAALNEYFATEFAARATRLTLIGDIATSWLTYAADNSLLGVARGTAEAARRSVNLTRARVEGGIAPRTDLRQAELILAQAESDVARSRTALAQDLNLLQLLVGAPIDPVLLPASIEQAGQALADLPPGLDSGILLRRPDVVQAEYQLRSANAQIGAARAALFPRISLTAALGLASSALTGMFSGDSFNWSVRPGLDLPIFDAGARRAGVQQTEAQRAAAVASYERTIQTAFREVADALARRGTIGEQLRADTALVNAAADNYRLTEARYRGGIDPFLASLDAQRSLYSAQRSLVNTRLERATNLVTLYRSLGGDATFHNLR